MKYAFSCYKITNLFILFRIDLLHNMYTYTYISMFVCNIAIFYEFLHRNDFITISKILHVYHASL